MAKLLKLRRGTTTQHGSFTGAEGEVTVDTDKETLVVHDGSTAGGHPVAAEDMANVSSSAIAGRLSNDSLAVGKLAAGTLPSDVKIADANVSGNLTIESADIVDGTIVNADVNASAAIAGTKISSNFGSQNIVTTGQLQINGALPTISLNDENNNPDFTIKNDNGGLRFRDETNGASRFLINSDGHVDVFGNTDFAQGIDVSGNITCTGDLYVTGNDAHIQGSAPTLHFTDTGDNPDYYLQNNSGQFRIVDGTNALSRFAINTDGHIDVVGNLDALGGVDVTGNITCTGTVDGRDVAADGTKLDGIESSATADQTAAEIRTLVESASDSNVFTDADHSKLNGIEASATADQTAAEVVSLLSGQNLSVARIYSTNGHLGRDSTDYIDFANNTSMDIVINGSTEFRFEADGDFHADGDVVAFSTTVSSDRKLKENIQVVPNALDKVEALNGVTFDWKRDGTPSAGVIAQEVQEVLLEAVKEVTPLKGGDSHLSVNYHALTSILIEAIKELKAEVEQLKGGQ